MTAPGLAIIIVAYGHIATLPATLNSLARQTLPAQSVVVVDNGDGSSATAARATMPVAQVITAATNLGFGGGCNLGVALTTAPLLAFINPDVVLQPDWIATVTAALDDPTVGIVGGKLCFPDGRVQHAGGVIHWPLALTDHRGYGQPDGPAWNEPLAVDYVTGAALAIRRDVWDRVAGFDPAFFPAYFEEVDLCLRVAAQGYSIHYLPLAVGIHQEASALGKTSSSYYRLYHANRLRLLWKHRPDPWLLTDWLPAELAYLRTTGSEPEIAALLWAYRTWQTAFLMGKSAASQASGWDQPPDEEQPGQGELRWALGQLKHKATLRPIPFTSRFPLAAALRTIWNRIATEAYLRPLLQQQNDYNAALLDLATALERQRRTADGAVLAQGMLLAKLLGAPLQATNELTPYPIGLTNNANTFRREQMYGDDGL
ncbi:MAG: glycosyltransferase family 2 protein [Herpetosiphonaceae bacterium]|nr:glycosyltransferase family 2 protein [Herpetosiphonaceae bacterium]